MSEELLQQLEDDLRAIRARQESTSTRVWDIVTKLSVPVVLAVFGWVWQMDRQVTRNTDHIATMAYDIKELPPLWLRDIVQELKAQNLDILQRLSRLEATIKSDDSR